MKKHFFLSLVLLTSLSANQVHAAGGNGTNWGNMFTKLIPLALLGGVVWEGTNHYNSNTKEIKDRYRYGLAKLGRIYMAGTCLAAFAAEPNQDFWTSFMENMKGVTLAVGLLGGAHAIANKKALAKNLRRAPVVNYMFTDPVDDMGEEQASIGTAARVITCYVLLKVLTIKLFDKIGIELRPYTIEGALYNK